MDVPSSVVYKSFVVDGKSFLPNTRQILFDCVTREGSQGLLCRCFSLRIGTNARGQQSGPGHEHLDLVHFPLNVAHALLQQLGYQPFAGALCATIRRYDGPKAPNKWITKSKDGFITLNHLHRYVFTVPTFVYTYCSAVVELATRPNQQQSLLLPVVEGTFQQPVEFFCPICPAVGPYPAGAGW